MHAVEKRFTWGHQANSPSGFLYDIHNTQTVASNRIVEHCLNCQNTLQHVDDKDIEVADFIVNYVSSRKGSISVH
jgi:hypothetical protein